MSKGSYIFTIYILTFINCMVIRLYLRLSLNNNNKIILLVLMKLSLQSIL